MDGTKMVPSKFSLFKQFSQKGKHTGRECWGEQRVSKKALWGTQVPKEIQSM